MLQVKLNGIKDVICEEIPELGEPEKGWAVVDVSAVGICGSEMHVYLGENPVLSPPRVQGHEFSGVIKALGNPCGFHVGERVTVNPVVGCGNCYHCNRNHRYLCDEAYVIGGEVTGAFQGEVKVPIRNLVPISPNLGMIDATLIEPSAVAVHTVGNLRDSNVLVIGQGTIGMLCMQVLKQQGNRTIAMDVSSYSLDISKKLGSDCVIHSQEQDAERSICEFLGDEPLDAVIDAVCNPATMNLAIKMVKKGGMIKTVGIPKSDFEFHLVDLLCKEITLETSYLYSEEDFIKARDLVEEGKILTKPLVSKVFRFPEAPLAYEYKLSNPSIKVVVEK